MSLVIGLSIMIFVASCAIFLANNIINVNSDCHNDETCQRQKDD